MKSFKKTQWIIIAVILFLITGGSIFIFSTQQQSTKKDVAAVQDERKPTNEEQEVILEIFSDPIFITLPGKKETKATDQQNVPVGSIVRAGETGRAQFLYPSHSVTRIDHNSKMILKAFDKDANQTNVGLQIGRIWSRVAKLFGKEFYATETTTVVAAVRGTSFGHGILDDGRNKITSLKKSVNVNCYNNTQQGEVNTQQKFFLDCEEGSPSDVVPIDSSDEDEWLQFNIDQDKILDERFGAETYDDEETTGATDTPTLTKTPTSKALTPTRRLSSPPSPTSVSRQTATPTPKPTLAKPTITPSPTTRLIPTATPTTPPSILYRPTHNPLLSYSSLTPIVIY